jgi:hypothetical protein
VWFLWSVSNTLNQANQTASQDIGSLTKASAISANISGLSASSTYYFQAVAQSSSGTTYGTISSFTTNGAGAQAPFAATGPASAVTASTATLEVTVNPNGADTHAWFLYGTNSNLSGATQTASVDLGAGIGVLGLNTPIGGLSPSTTYYFQPVAQNSIGMTSGSILSFVTTAPATFSVTGTAVSVAPGATTGNTSTITVTPYNLFTGTVTLTCAVTPIAASDPATCTVTSPVTISSATAQTTTLTVYTTAAILAQSKPLSPFWPATGATALACIFLIGIPARRRRWLTMLGLLVLIVTAAGMGCGGGGPGGGICGCPVNNPGTTPGNYVITVTGTSGSTPVIGVVALTVQ